MYISPFWCGVIATLLVEVVIIVACSLHDSWAGEEKGNKEEEKGDRDKTQ